MCRPFKNLTFLSSPLSVYLFSWCTSVSSSLSSTLFLSVSPQCSASWLTAHHRTLQGIKRVPRTMSTLHQRRHGPSPQTTTTTTTAARSRNTRSTRPSPCATASSSGPSSSWPLQAWLLNHLSPSVYECLDSKIARFFLPDALRYRSVVPGIDPHDHDALLSLFRDGAPDALEPPQHTSSSSSGGAAGAAAGMSSELGKVNLLVPYDPSDPVHVRLLKSLWDAHDQAVTLHCNNTGGSRGGAELSFQPVHHRWASPIGFQREDPSTDFRGGGVLSLAILSRFVWHYPLLWREAVCIDSNAVENGAADASGSDIIDEEHPDFCFPAATSLNISVYLASQCGMLSGSRAAAAPSVCNGVSRYYLERYVHHGESSGGPQSSASRRRGGGADSELLLSGSSSDGSSSGSPLDRLVRLHAVYFHRFVTHWAALPRGSRHVMQINALLQDVYREMDERWVKHPPTDQVVEKELSNV